MKKIAAERRDSDPAFAKFQGSENKVSKVSSQVGNDLFTLECGFKRNNSGCRVAVQTS